MDQVFRRNRPGPLAKWDQLDPSLHIAYIASQADAPITPCAICSEVDHTTEDCALSTVTPPTKKAAPPPGSRDMAKGSLPRLKHQPPPRPPTSGASKCICLSWNQGKCAFPGACNFQHICATCRGQHPAHDCAQTPPDTGFHQQCASQPQSQAYSSQKDAGQ